MRGEGHNARDAYTHGIIADRRDQAVNDVPFYVCVEEFCLRAFEHTTRRHVAARMKFSDTQRKSAHTQ